MVGALGPAARDKSCHAVVGVELDATVAIGPTIGHQRERHRRAGRSMRVVELSEVEVGERVTVDQEERVGADDGQRLAHAAGGAKNGRLFPGIAHARAEVAAVADRRGDRFRTMMQVEHDVCDTLGSQPPDDAPNQRFSGHGHGGLGPHIGERPQPRAETGVDQRQRGRR